MAAQKRLIQWAKKEEMNTIVVLMPESARLSMSPSKPYGSYEVPSRVRLGARQAEEIISESATASKLMLLIMLPQEYLQYTMLISPASSPAKPHTVQSNSTSGPILGVPPVCHASIDSCLNATNHCSGHGKCYQKSNTCVTCGCVPQNETFAYGNDGEKRGYRFVYYGGAACQKRDVSTAFWLIATFTVVMVGLVGWAIGMLFSIGEEKLPGIIGAGVSSNRGPK
jgi:hypothetical protein